MIWIFWSFVFILRSDELSYYSENTVAYEGEHRELEEAVVLHDVLPDLPAVMTPYLI